MRWPLLPSSVRPATYINEWLLLARSVQESVTHMDHVLAHLADLGVNGETGNNVLSLRQDITCLGLTLNRLTYRARLSGERVDTFRPILVSVVRLRWVTFGLCVRLLGLMASALMSVRLGRLYMRGFQLWAASLRLDPMRHTSCRVTMSVMGSYSSTLEVALS